MAVVKESFEVLVVEKEHDVSLLVLQCCAVVVGRVVGMIFVAVVVVVAVVLHGSCIDPLLRHVTSEQDIRLR